MREVRINVVNSRKQSTFIEDIDKEIAMLNERMVILKEMMEYITACKKVSAF